ncbi:hypothetical protein Q5P01_021840 [Channa striata]|uniref:Uncharacterized protein n=1 Tax=Channa striata TaxID=64152 RepID=A0AA88LUW3_CHASR|nr:hypothetical protein Q5P01_021840 [Channa striata]
METVLDLTSNKSFASLLLIALMIVNICPLAAHPQKGWIRGWRTRRGHKETGHKDPSSASQIFHLDVCQCPRSSSDKNM